MDSSPRTTRLVGLGVSVLGAASLAVTVVVGRALARAGFDVSTALGFRYGLASVMLFALLAATGRPLVPARGERVAVFLLGALAYALETSLFYAGLTRGSAAAVVLLFYSYPAMLVLLEVPLRRRRPSPVTRAALVAALAGTSLIAVAGERVDVTPVGAALALGSGATFAVYLVLTDLRVRRTGPLTAAAWFCAGVTCSLVLRGLVAGGLEDPAGHWWQMVVNGLVSASAFSAIYAAVRRLGPSHTGVVMTLEAWFAILLAAAFLGEAIRPAHVLGGVLVVGAAVAIALAPEARSPEARPTTPTAETPTEETPTAAQLP